MREYPLENNVFLRTAFLNEDHSLPPSPPTQKKKKKKESGYAPEWKHDLNPNLFARKAPASNAASLSLECSKF